MFSNLNIRKYRAIVIGIISFLVLVLGILGLNFYTSYETEANAEKVNIAGRQRMLSQRIAKSLLNTFEQYQTDSNYRVPYQELRDSVTLFDSTLNAFSNDGSICIITASDGISIPNPVQSLLVKKALTTSYTPRQGFSKNPILCLLWS